MDDIRDLIAEDQNVDLGKYHNKLDGIDEMITPTIGKELIRVSDYEKCLIVYVKQPGIAAPGEILIKCENTGRKWISYREMMDDYVEAF